MEHTSKLFRRQVLQLGALAAVTPLATGAAAQTDDVSRAATAALNGWINAFNSGEPTARFFTHDSTLIRGNGVFVGSQRIAEMEQRESGAGLRLALKIQRVERIGPDGAWALCDYELTVPNKDGAAPQVIPGVSVHVLQRQGDAWQMRVASFTRVQAPAPRPTSAPPN